MNQVSVPGMTEEFSETSRPALEPHPDTNPLGMGSFFTGDKVAKA
jgi:hypothetical protein